MDYKKRTLTHHQDVLVKYDKEKFNILFRDRWNFYEDEPLIMN